MKRADQVELSLIAAAVGVFALLTRDRVFEMSFGAWVGYGAVLLLAQGLVRDVTTIVRRRLAARTETGERVKMRCLCAESSFGLLFGVLGATLFFTGIGDVTRLSSAVISAWVVGILLFGLFIKNYVIVVRRVTDHSLIEL